MHNLRSSCAKLSLIILALNQVGIVTLFEIYIMLHIARHYRKAARSACLACLTTTINLNAMAMSVTIRAPCLPI
jgi:hypothetical protein